MPNYYYDGSFDGLLTVIFKAYNYLTWCLIEKVDKNEIIRVHPETEQLTLGLDDIHITTDFDEARRVEKTICKKLSKDFLHCIRTCFLSCEKNKDTVIVYSVYKAISSSEKIINSMDMYGFLMKKMVRRVLNERHKYLGVLRFREMKDKTLFSSLRL